MQYDNDIRFEAIVGHEWDFYGVDNNMFALGVGENRVVFEAAEDPGDGYRSYLETIRVAKDVADHGIFFSRPLATVRIMEVDENRGLYRGQFEGYEFRDNVDDHVWLTVGTDNIDCYYPVFIFSYRPKKTPDQEVDL